VADGRERIRVAVVFGGRSSEHAVSCSTAASVLSSLDRDRYDVIPVGITKHGAWVLQPDEPDRFRLAAGHQPEVDADSAAVVLRTDPTRPDLVSLAAPSPGASLSGVDVVFPVLHGPFGEDGTIQGLLEMAGLPYVGAGVLSSAVAMDKSYTKVILSGAGLPVLPYTTFRLRDWEHEPEGITEAVSSLGYPVFVKPARGGSSLGITKVVRAEDLAAAVTHAAQHDPKIIVDAGVEGGRELEVGVLGGLDGRPQCSPIAEIELSADVEFYDFDTKYLASEEQVRLTLPADVPTVVAERITELALRAFAALDVEGLARVDFFLTGKGDVLINEVNTMPGFTPMSMFPRMWQAAGMDYAHLLDRLIDLAVQRDPGMR
jgi:D-alanine-D-alanine ligase